MKTRIVKFSYGTVKDASLHIPAEAYSIVDVVTLIRQSYLEYAFRPGCGLMSDECVTSSIGQANFFAGALGGWETRLAPEVFKSVKDYAADTMGLAIMVVKFRKCNAGISNKEAYRQASRNEALTESERKMLGLLADNSTD